jgi:hypothetical protein
MTWQLLNSAALYSSSSSGAAASAAASADSAAVLHPLGAQLKFPAALGTLDLEVRAVANAASVWVCACSQWSAVQANRQELCP